MARKPIGYLDGKKDGQTMSLAVLLEGMQAKLFSLYNYKHCF